MASRSFWNSVRWFCAASAFLTNCWRDRRRALDGPAAQDVGQQRAADAADVDAVVAVEAPVLDGDDRVLHRRGDLARWTQDPVLRWPGRPTWCRPCTSRGPSCARCGTPAGSPAPAGRRPAPSSSRTASRRRPGRRGRAGSAPGAACRRAGAGLRRARRRREGAGRRRTRRRRHRRHRRCPRIRGRGRGRRRRPRRRPAAARVRGHAVRARTACADRQGDAGAVARLPWGAPDLRSRARRRARGEQPVSRRGCQVVAHSVERVRPEEVEQAPAQASPRREPAARAARV